MGCQLVTNFRGAVLRGAGSDESNRFGALAPRRPHTLAGGLAGHAEAIEMHAIGAGRDEVFGARTQPGSFGGCQIDLEHAEPDADAVVAQRVGDALPAPVVGDVVDDHVAVKGLVVA